jgi:hypothetical protein
MPNYYTTQVTINGKCEDLMAFRNKHFVAHLLERTDESGNPATFFDFNSVIPKPPILDGTESSTAVESGLIVLDRDDLLRLYSKPQEMLDWGWVKEAGVTDVDGLKQLLLKRYPECIEKAKKAIAAYEATGYASWYDWSIVNWGTKWNSSDLRIVKETERELVFWFETASTPPRPVLDKLVDMWPQLQFEFIGHDEGEEHWERVA